MHPTGTGKQVATEKKSKSQHMHPPTNHNHRLQSWTFTRREAISSPGSAQTSCGHLLGSAQVVTNYLHVPPPRDRGKTLQRNAAAHHPRTGVSLSSDGIPRCCNRHAHGANTRAHTHTQTNTNTIWQPTRALPIDAARSQRGSTRHKRPT